MNDATKIETVISEMVEVMRCHNLTPKQCQSVCELLNSIVKKVNNDEN